MMVTHKVSTGVDWNVRGHGPAVVCLGTSLLCVLFVYSFPAVHPSVRDNLACRHPHASSLSPCLPLRNAPKGEGRGRGSSNSPCSQMSPCWAGGGSPTRIVARQPDLAVDVRFLLGTQPIWAAGLHPGVSVGPGHGYRASVPFLHRAVMEGKVSLPYHQHKAEPGCRMCGGGAEMEMVWGVTSPRMGIHICRRII